MRYLLPSKKVFNLQLYFLLLKTYMHVIIIAFPVNTQADINKTVENWSGYTISSRRNGHDMMMSYKEN